MFDHSRLFIALLLPVITLSFSLNKNAPTRTSPLFTHGKALPMPLGKVAVTGATGRVGKFVCLELLDRGVEVVAMVRNIEKAETELPCQHPKLTVTKCDLTSKQEIATAIEGCDSVFWCATGFSDTETGLIEKVKSFFGIALAPAPKKSIDSIGVPAIADCMLKNAREGTSSHPKVVMLSSAGVTRPSWTHEKKTKLAGCADIPIVRLNPFGILDIKADSENKLRETGVAYCIVRPCGLNDDWPKGSRPVFSQGDVACGRINRSDVARILVDVASASEACGKTFEVFSLDGYAPPSNGILPLLEKLKTDDEGLSEESVENTYNLMQQLLPGEQQDAASLAMGQTYEQLDEGETGRLGERGSEDIGQAGIKPTSV